MIRFAVVVAEDYHENDGSANESPPEGPFWHDYWIQDREVPSNRSALLQRINAFSHTRGDVARGNTQVHIVSKDTQFTRGFYQ
jgi:hypothetical protein